MGDIRLVDKLPRWIAFILQAISLYLVFWLWISFSFLTPLLYFGSTTTKIVLWTLLIYQFTICKESKLYRRINQELRIQNYFPEYKIIFEDEFTPSTKQLFCSHPHGILALGLGIAHHIEPRFSNNNYLGASILPYLPFSGIFFTLFGIKSVGKHNFNKLMKEQKNIYFIPGGFESSTITKYGIDRVYIKKRKGFIKYALQYGYNVHPCYCFGENKIFQGISFGTKIGFIMNKFSIPAIIPFTYYFQFPYRPKISAVVGKGIEFPQIVKPTEKDINNYHELYINALVSLFDKYKKQFGGCEQLEVM